MLREEEIAENLRNINNRITQACEKAGRKREEVTLIAVSKMNPYQAVMAAHFCGQNVFGENKVQEMCDKIEAIPEALKWHLIGHLQTNKVKYIIGKVELIHSVDSFHLAKVISDESAKKNVVSHILLEVNIGREESKYGVMPENVQALAEQISTLDNIVVEGLMCVAPICTKSEDNRPYFKQMRELFIDIRSKNYDNIHMNVLSMGMTSDFETAIEEGATHVRVGSGIFGERDYGTK